MLQPRLSVHDAPFVQSKLLLFADHCLGGRVSPRSSNRVFGGSMNWSHLPTALPSQR
ncbi:MAG: hypothetical protein KatS3mg060_1699 [Dehalococcoidia bacterium]|jgi:hypothetical protein|nr:MAG: hypothetical protein KatS3mg060_1699 [Dehalococcoidia bacterium]